MIDLAVRWAPPSCSPPASRWPSPSPSTSSSPRGNCLPGDDADCHYIGLGRTSAYLAAVFLVSDAHRAGSADLERYFRTRAVGAAIAAGVVAAADLIAIHGDARYVFDRLTAQALPLLILS